PELVQLWYQMALGGRRDLPLAPGARAGFEMSLLRMLAFRPADGADAGAGAAAGGAIGSGTGAARGAAATAARAALAADLQASPASTPRAAARPEPAPARARAPRSEEHTSELQSRENL